MTMVCYIIPFDDRKCFHDMIDITPVKSIHMEEQCIQFTLNHKSTFHIP